MIKKLFSLIESKGIEVYMPAKKTGKCASAYAVVKEEKSELCHTGRGINTYFAITIVAPLSNYASLEETTAAVKAALKGSAFTFCSSKAEGDGADEEGYKRVLTYRVLKPLTCRKK